MAEPIPVIPTLYNQSAQILTKIEDIAAYVIQWFFANPGATSMVMEQSLASFRKFNSMKGDNPAAFCSMISDTLTTILKRYKDDVTVECTYEIEPKKDANGNLLGTYGFTITVMNADGTPVIPWSSILIDRDHKTLGVRFTNDRTE